MTNRHNPRRRSLLTATTAVGALGVAFTAIPFVASMLPSTRARAAGAPVEVDISKLQLGQIITVEWRGKPVWVLFRTDEMLSNLDKRRNELVDPDSKNSSQPEYCQNPERAKKPEVAVLLGVCTHLGCAPSAKLKTGDSEGMTNEWQGGFYCPCHGSIFDLAGRVFKNVPAAKNLEIPPYSFVSADRLVIGTDTQEG